MLPFYLMIVSLIMETIIIKDIREAITKKETEIKLCSYQGYERIYPKMGELTDTEREII